ncbi:hypothetical protein LXL04_007046 [Taraxacum kok-saghyz]
MAAIDGSIVEEVDPVAATTIMDVDKKRDNCRPDAVCQRKVIRVGGGSRRGNSPSVPRVKQQPKQLFIAGYLTCLKKLSGKRCRESRKKRVLCAFTKELPAHTRSTSNRSKSVLELGFGWFVLTMKKVEVQGFRVMRIAIGYDEETIIVKVGREEPVASMDNFGKIIWAKHNEI